MKKVLCIIYALASIQMCCTSCNQRTKEDDAILFAMVEEKPRFLNGDLSNFSKWVYSQLKYPQDALGNDITGKVIVRFTISKEGGIKNVLITESAHPTLDKEVMRVISQVPKWTPGKSHGTPIDVEYIFPIVFDNKKAVAPETDPTIQPADFISPDTGKRGPNEFTKWYFYRVSYPEIARKENIMGKGKIAFEITETGDLENIRVVQGAHPLLDSAAIQVVRESPKWIPATKDGSPIKTTFIFPYVFLLK